VNLWRKNIDATERLTNALQEVNEELPIYFVYDDDVGVLNWRIEHIQFLLSDKKITMVSEEALADIEGEYYLIHYGAGNLKTIDDYEIVNQAYGLLLLAPKGSELAAQWQTYDAEHPYVFTDVMMQSATAPERYSFMSDHVEGFVCYCQDLTLQPGTYQVDMYLDVTQMDSEGAVGSYDVSAEYGEQSYCGTELFASQVGEDGKLHVSYEFTTEELLEHAEFRLYAYGNARIELEQLSFTMK
jgi:hypothetical protein